MKVVPVAIPFTKPVLLTVAIDELLLLHVPPDVAFVRVVELLKQIALSPSIGDMLGNGQMSTMV